MAEWLEKWKRLQKRYVNGMEKSQLLNSRVLWLGVIGVLLLGFGSVFDGKAIKSAVPDEPPAAKVAQRQAVPAAGQTDLGEQALEEKLAQLLCKVQGAGDVAVSVTFDGSARLEHEKNKTKEAKTVQEKDVSGGVRTTTESKESEEILMSKESGADKPVMVMETRPEIKGVLVVAEGAANSQVKADLTRAVETGLGIACYKITVLPQRL